MSFKKYKKIYILFKLPDLLFYTLILQKSRSIFFILYSHGGSVPENT